MGPFVLGMTETQLLAMGQPSTRSASNIGSNNGPIPVTAYCYWDQAICVEVNQTNHLVIAMYVGGYGSCPYKTSSGITCGSTAAQLGQAFDLGMPVLSETNLVPAALNAANRGMLLKLGYQNTAAGTVTRFYFVDSNFNFSETPHTHVRSISMTYDNYTFELH